MPELTDAIRALRESVPAILRVWVEESMIRPTRVKAAWAGSAFCVTKSRHLVTAFHILNGGKPRRPNDRFYAFVVPGNEDTAFHFPVTGFPVERPDVDMAVLEIGPCPTDEISIPTVNLSFMPQPDGTRVITMGFPAPEIAAFNVDAHGNYAGGQLFLKSHANEGIISAQYDLPSARAYELNVGWHHGESSGPIVSLSDPPTVFALMQHYRPVKTPHGVMPGPHRGYAISAIRQNLPDIGVAGA